jgi:hypothetical protein
MPTEDYVRNRASTGRRDALLIRNTGCSLMLIPHRSPALYGNEVEGLSSLL